MLLAFAFLCNRQTRERGFDSRARFGDALFEVGAGGYGVAQAAFQGPVFLSKSAGDFDQAGDTIAKHLEFFVHVVGW